VTLVLLIILIASFALLLTAHVALAVGLALQPPRWRALVALVVAPLAPYWGYLSGKRVWSLLWLVSLLAYVTARVIAAIQEGGVA
jgi:hypothetical protein